ncbi:hypothetical protein QAD02_005084 [Eretmocerus hayati]|uniref:Uncharacterized protein n=1 Tax=Eretmocerus hayati TaxID=131215 RepID=A0ACC2NRU6_9HYME|nr:hypothetical protein QAD02_005084 [Eretmocerus hayati]
MDSTRTFRQLEIKPSDDSRVNSQQVNSEQVNSEQVDNEQVNSSSPCQMRILDRYPRFLDYDGELICREYDELYPACSQFENNLQRYTPRVIKYCEAFNADKLEKVSILVQEDDLKAIILLSEIIPLSKPGGGVDSDFTLVMNGGAEKPSKQPFMKCNLNDGFGANYRINVDGTDILVGQSPSRAVELLLKAHYVFNIAFCAELQYFYNFLTNFFMEIDKPKGNNSFLNLSILNTQV